MSTNLKLFVRDSSGCGITFFDFDKVSRNIVPILQQVTKKYPMASQEDVDITDEIDLLKAIQNHYFEYWEENCCFPSNDASLLLGLQFFLNKGYKVFISISY
jgi:hypothetical protein